MSASDVPRLGAVILIYIKATTVGDGLLLQALSFF